jgi:hypothetical protein
MGIVSDFEQRVQAVRLRLYQEEELDALLLLLQEIDDLLTERPTKDAYDLKVQAYRSLRGATSDNADIGYDLILQKLLPWLIGPDGPDDADYARGSARTIFTTWLAQYPEDARQGVLQAVLETLGAALHSQPTAQLCWTISGLGYRQTALVDGLWELVHRDTDEIGDVALRALAQLGIQEPGRRQLLDELHKRFALRRTLPLIGALTTLADITTVRVAESYLNQPPAENESPVLRILVLGILAHIADAHDDMSDLQEEIWNMMVRLYEAAPERYTSDIYLNGSIASQCDTSSVPTYLIKWLEQHPEDTEQALNYRRLLYLRLSECVRPRQLMGVSLTDSPETIALLWRDANRNSHNTRLWTTLESRTKQQAWETLILLGDDATLSRSQFDSAVVQEESGFLRGTIMELLACFRWRRLPSQVVAWITEREDIKRESVSGELPFRRGAVRMARSAATRQAFDALLDFGITFEGATLREPIEALASVSLALTRKRRPGIVETLLETIEHGEDERHRTAAAEALSWIASENLLPPQHLPRLAAIVEDERRGDFERSCLVHVYGQVPRQNVTPAILDILRLLTTSSNRLVAVAAMEALAQNGTLLELPEVLESVHTVHAVGDRWDYASDTEPDNRTTSMIVTVYSYAHERLAPAMASLLRTVNAFKLPALLSSLEAIHAMTGEQLPVEVRDALQNRLSQLQDALYITPAELLQACARFIPDTLAGQEWREQWNAWGPETRAALAEALGKGSYSTQKTQEQASLQLLQLMCDAQYRVRRAAYRSLAGIAPTIVFHTCIAWASAPMIALRQRAAEAMHWLPQAETNVLIDQEGRALAADADPVVREAWARSFAERRQRSWAHGYLEQVRTVYGKGNKQRLAVWRYAHALTSTGDDSTIVELQKDLASYRMAAHERQWLRWILDKSQEQWQKATRQWPEPWFDWTGEVIYEQGTITAGESIGMNGLCSLYQQNSIGEARQGIQWGGIFWPDMPTPIKSGEIVMITLADGREGQAITREYEVEHIVRLSLEGIGRLL